MPDPVNQEVKIAIIDTSHPNLIEIENISSKNVVVDSEAKNHGIFTGRALVKQIKADGEITNPSKTKIQSYIAEMNSLNSIELAIKNGNQVISASFSVPRLQDYKDGHFLSKEFVKKISSFDKDVLIFCGVNNNDKNNFYANSNAHNIMVNNHYTIPVGAIYYKRELYNRFPNVSKDKMFHKLLLSNTPGSSVFIADSGLFFWEKVTECGTSFATPHVAGSGGTIACRYLKPRTQGNFSTLVKKYLGYSAKHINQNELFKGWSTEHLSRHMRDIENNGAEDCNFGLGLGFSYEHGTGEYDPIAFANLCRSHLPAFDMQLLEDKTYSQSIKPSPTKTKQITVAFDCDEQKGYIDGVYFAFKGLREIDIKRATLISPGGSKSDLVNDYSSLRSSAKNVQLSAAAVKYLNNNNRGHSYLSNRHFGQKIKGKWIAIIETHDAITRDQKTEFSLNFKRFDQKNNQMIINNNIFTSGRNKFTYKNTSPGLHYLNFSATSSYNHIDLRERNNFALLKLYHPNPKLRTQHDPEDFLTNLRATVSNPKTVTIKIDSKTVIDCVADGMGNGKIIGNEANNTLLGLSGDDSLEGNGGNDHLYPGSSLEKGDIGFGGHGDDTHHLYSYESGTYYAFDEKGGNDSIVFNVSYKKTTKSYTSPAPTKYLSFDVDYKRLSLDDVKFYKENNTKYWMQGGNKKVYFNPDQINSVVLKHELTGKTKTYDRKAIDMLCSR